MITLADIPALRADAEILRDVAWRELVQGLPATTMNRDLIAQFEAAQRELDIIAKMEREIIATGKTNQGSVNHEHKTL